MTLLGQNMPWLRSAAFALVLPAGCQYESRARRGVAGMVCEMVQRGAGSRSSRQIVAESDNLGLDRSSSVTTAHTSYGAAMPTESLDEALRLYTDIVRRPHLPGDQLEDARSVSLQELRANEDEPAQRVMIRLKERHYGDDLGHSPQGTLAGLQAVTASDVREFFEAHYTPRGATLAIAGNFDWERTVDLVEQLFEGWPQAPEVPPPAAAGTPGYEHIEHPSQQTHIGFSFPAWSYDHPDYFTLRAAVGVLSDGMSSRLFDRVREQRGLCYTVSAGTHSMRGVGGVFGYAGTTAERAQETLDVTLAEIDKLGATVEEDELDRFKVRIHSQLIMQQESSSSRAAAMASDWYFLRRLLTPEEIEAAIDAVTPAKIAALWDQLPKNQYRIVTLGPKPLQVNGSR
ncbi:M16 family metallopeptidase [Candidatus Laterigemmans baculatus]|nr:pitrilysin family protein [Candidatus Laterigemmans baculatus]